MRDILQAAKRSGRNRSSPVPHDPAIPGSALLPRPAQLVEVVMSLLVDSLDSDSRLLESRVDILRHAPGRRYIVEIELLLGGGRGDHIERRHIITKLYSSDHGAKVYQTLRELWSHGFASGHLTVPRPLAYEPALKLLVLDWARGESLRSQLLAQRDVSQAMDRAAQWLLKLHSCGVQGGRRYHFSHHLHTLTQWKQSVTEVCPETDPLFVHVLARLKEKALTVPDQELTPTHRDFSPDHLLVNEEKITGLDFDEFCQYDPAFDVAHFVAHVRFLGLKFFGTLVEFDHLADRFQASYKSGAGDYSAARVRFHQAVAYVKLAYIVAMVQRPQAWRRMATTLLQEAQRFM